MEHSFNSIFEKARQGDRISQQLIYERLSPKMLSIAKSYVGSQYDAEEVLVEGFYKVFTKIKDCKSGESFVAWVRRIIINEAISYIRKNKNLLYFDADVNDLAEEIIDEIEENFPEFDVQKVLSDMPLGYRLVFNLYIFEEKKHSEIAEILNINVGTSKSQLNKAKKWLIDYFRIRENEKF